MVAKFAHRGGSKRFGYFLSCEEYSPSQFVEQARLAEEAGFDALWISDHFHPWNDAQGQSPFVWSVIGAIAESTNLPVTTAVMNARTSNLLASIASEREPRNIPGVMPTATHASLEVVDDVAADVERWCR